LRILASRRYFLIMAMNPLDADLDHRPLRPIHDTPRQAHPSWMGFLGGVAVLAIGILAAVGIWRFAGDDPSQLSVAELTETETLLDQLGFPPGTIDGVIDDEGRNAIRDFQVTAGLDVDGDADLALLDELRAAKAELGGN
jgi:hypothetical protein